MDVSPRVPSDPASDPSPKSARLRAIADKELDDESWKPKPKPPKTTEILRLEAEWEEDDFGPGGGSGGASGPSALDTAASRGPTLASPTAASKGPAAPTGADDDDGAEPAQNGGPAARGKAREAVAAEVARGRSKPAWTLADDLE